LLLALVVALGALGVGYAMWSDTITIDGTVNTGTVDINVDNYSGTYVYKDLGPEGDGHGTVIWCGDVLDNPYDGLKRYMLVAYGSSAAGTANDSVVVTFDNLFPIYDDGELAAYCADFSGTYVGTIPVHIYAAIETKDQWLKDLWDDGFIKPVYKVWDAAGNLLSFPDGVVQLHQGYTYEVKLCIVIPQDDNTGTTQEELSGMSGSFTATIVAYQWNETYTPPVSAP